MKCYNYSNELKSVVSSLDNVLKILQQSNSSNFFQVQYNPGNPRRTTIPQPSGSRGGPPPPIPEEIRPHHHSPASNHSGGDKEK